MASTKRPGGDSFDTSDNISFETDSTATATTSKNRKTKKKPKNTDDASASTASASTTADSSTISTPASTPQHTKPPPKQRGPKKQPEEHQLKHYVVKLYPDEIQECDKFRIDGAFAARRDMLLHLVRSQVGGGTVGIAQSTPTKNRQGTNRGGAGAFPDGGPPSPIIAAAPRGNFAQPAAPPEAVPPEAAPPRQPRVPVYRNAGTLMIERPARDDAQIDDGLAIDELDPYEFTAEDAAYHYPLHFVEEHPGAQLGQSFNISDNQGHRLDPGPPTAADEARRQRIAAAKKKEPAEYDYSKSTKLLPDDYYERFSADQNVRLHVSGHPIVTKDGEYLEPPPDPQRSAQKRMEPALNIVTDGRWIVEFHQLLKLIPTKCYVASCTASHDLRPEKLKEGIKREGAVLRLQIKCYGDPLVHTFIWTSSRCLQHLDENHSQTYALNVMLASAIVLSGCNWSRANLLFKTLNVRTPKREHFRRVQMYLVTPAVEECWRMEQAMMLETMRRENLQGICAADGQFDSPGHSASYCTYVQMLVELEREEAGKIIHREKTSYVLDFTVIEKRQTELNSVRMELCGFLRSVLGLEVLDAPVKEIVTDQHLQILALMQKAREAPEDFTTIAKDALALFDDVDDEVIRRLLYRCRNTKHSLDVWHRTKNIGFHLGEERVGKERSSHLLPWIPHVKNHFWYVLMTYRGNLDLIKAKWYGLLNHALGECETATHVCDHIEENGEAPHPGDDDPLMPRAPKLTRGSKTFEAIERAVKSKELAKNFHYYENYRHTGSLESYNALQLVYTLKRLYHVYLDMITRKQTCAMDNNDAVHREVKRNSATDDPQFRKVFMRHGRQWAIKFRKEEKKFRHIPHLMARILAETCRTPFRTGLHRRQPYAIPNDPKSIAPNMAPLQSTLEEILRHRWSRFATHLWTAVNDNEEEMDEDDMALDEDVDASENEEGQGDDGDEDETLYMMNC